MYTINTIVQVSSVRHTRHRTFAQLRLYGEHPTVLRLPFIMRMILSEVKVHVEGKHKRHQHWSVRQQPPLLQGLFAEVAPHIEEKEYYSIQLVPNCSKSGISRYAYYCISAVKLETLPDPETFVHTIQEDVEPYYSHLYLQQC